VPICGSGRRSKQQRPKTPNLDQYRTTIENKLPPILVIPLQLLFRYKSPLWRWKLQKQLHACRNKIAYSKPGPAKKDDKSQAPENKKTTTGDNRGPKDKQKSDEKGASKQRKAFITLSYIVVAYIVCWVPFHFVFDVSLASPEIVPEVRKQEEDQKS